MNKLLREYVKSSDTWARSKAPRHRPFGLLQPLSIPSRPWGSIAMDFITDLPTVRAKNSILVVVDRLTKMALSPLFQVNHRRRDSSDGTSDCMDSPRKLCPTKVPSLHPSYGVAYSNFLELTFNYLHFSTSRQMDKPNGQTRHSSNTFAALWTTNRTTRWTYYLKQSLLITTQRMHQPGSVHSLSINVFIPSLALKFMGIL
jgi:hypothetical protein